MNAMSRAANRRRTPAAVIENEPKAPTGRWLWIYCFCASFVIALAVFAPALNGTFIFDDFHLPFADPHAAEMPARFWIGGVRPALIATYWLNFLISGTNPLGYHVVNVFLHAVTSVVIFLIYDRLLAISRTPFPSILDRRWFALFGAALFLLHPLQTEPVDYIAGRSELLSGCFFFAAWLVFLRNFEQNASFGLTLKILILGGLGILGKESAISLPGLLLLTDFYFSDLPIGKQVVRRFKLYSVFLIGALSAAALILRSLTRGTAAGFSSGVRPFDYALTQCRVVLIYLRLFFIPAGQNADWHLPFYHSFRHGAAGWYVVALLLVLALALWLRKRDRLISFGIMAFFLMLAPTSSIVPISDALAERRMYLPIAGLILAVLGVAARIRLTTSWRWAGATALILACAVLSYFRSAVWTSDLNLWSDSAHANPANYRAHSGLGAALLRRKDCVEAAGEFATALSQENSNNEVLWNLAEAYQCAGKSAEALSAFQSYAVRHPTGAAYDKIGFIEATLSHVTPALDAFEQALKLDPKDATAYAYRGIARVALNDPQDGQADFRRALELDPGNQVAAQGIAKLAARR
jgi:tetratricopeptide (TPR) repeat protein